MLKAKKFELDVTEFDNILASASKQQQLVDFTPAWSKTKRSEKYLSEDLSLSSYRLKALVRMKSRKLLEYVQRLHTCVMSEELESAGWEATKIQLIVNCSRHFLESALFIENTICLSHKSFDAYDNEHIENFAR